MMFTVKFEYKAMVNDEVRMTGAQSFGPLGYHEAQSVLHDTNSDYRRSSPFAEEGTVKFFITSCPVLIKEAA